MYVITIIRNQHSIHTCILAAFRLPASLASKTGSYVVLKIFPVTQHVQADKEASAASPAGRRLRLSCNLSVQFDNDQTTRYYNHESWRDYRHLIFELSEPKILVRLLWASGYYQMIRTGWVNLHKHFWDNRQVLQTPLLIPPGSPLPSTAPPPPTHTHLLKI